MEKINQTSKKEAFDLFFKCCASKKWAQAMADQRPYSNREDLVEKADKVWFALKPSDWQESIAGHPKIGDLDSLKKKFASSEALTREEQSGVSGASEETLKSLKQGNDNYEAKFGFIFLVCATGKSAEEMLDILNARIPNSLEKELNNVALEQSKITKLRLEKLT